MAKTVIAFDLFGTILSTDSIGEELAKLYGEDAAAKIAPLARRYQLEYTWRCNSMNVYRPFDELTRWSFNQAITEVVGLEDGWPQADRDRIMNAYNGLSPYPDVQHALKLLRSNSNLDVYIFSNGTRNMLSSCLSNCQPSTLSTELNDIFPASGHISVDDEALKVFKPDRRTYEYVTTLTEMQFTPEKVWLVSSNPFDVVGARNAGLSAAWVDRGGKGWTDGLGDCLGESKGKGITVDNLEAAVQGILNQSQNE